MKRSPILTDDRKKKKKKMKRKHGEQNFGVVDLPKDRKFDIIPQVSNLGRV